MSFYLRTAKGRIPQRSRASMRAAAIMVLAGYPAGALIALNADRAGGGEVSFIIGVGGLVLIALSVLAFFFIAPSYMQRIVGEQISELDDLERDLRQKAFSFSYQLLTGLVAACIFYLAVANDERRLTLWAPSTYSHWNTIFWGVLLYSFTLPTAYLTWTMPDISAELADEDDVEISPHRPRARWWLWGMLAAGASGGLILALLTS